MYACYDFIPRLTCLVVLLGVSLTATAQQVTNTGDSGEGSLRHAITNAVSGELITFDASLDGQTIVLEGTQLTISETLTIDSEGKAITVDADRKSRVFYIEPDNEVEIAGLTITSGRDGGIHNAGILVLSHVIVTRNGASPWGGHGGGIYNSGSLTVVNGTISDNFAAEGGVEDGGHGGGIYSTGILRVIDSRIITNRAGSGGDRSQDSYDDYLDGGAGGWGGGIYSDGEVTVTNSVIEGNSAGRGGNADLQGMGGAGGHGGGMYVRGAGTITNSSVIDNTGGSGGVGSFDYAGSGGNGGGIAGDADMRIVNSTIRSNHAGSAHRWGLDNDSGSGGGIYNSGMLTVEQSDVIGNATGSERSHECGAAGGGIRNRGNLTLRQSTVADNEAMGGSCASWPPGGGGVALDGDAVVDQSTIAGNTARTDGGGIFFMGEGDVAITNSTISGNSAGAAHEDERLRHGVGGGVLASFSGTFTYVNSTIAANSAGEAGGGIYSWIGATLRNTLVAGNESHEGADCYDVRPDFFRITSAGYNLVGDETGCPADHSEDLTVDPATVFTNVIGPLADNGGPTPTHALLEESPAIDAGSCTDAEGDAILTDQRGEPRPSVDPGGSGDGTGCDISAFEFQFEVVGDETAPDIALSEGPLVLWPPNNAYRTLDVSEMIASVTDDQDESLSVDDVVIAAVSSDEPDGGNRRGSDIVLSSSCRSVDVRAARQGGGNGRVYTVHLEVADASGNVGTASYHVHVLQNRKADVAIHDGEFFRVDGSCGASDLAAAMGKRTDVEDGAETPTEFGLGQNYPNPFNPSTEIAFALPESAEVSLVVYDALGRTVARLVDRALPAGRHRVQWNAANVASGVYVYRLSAGTFESTRRMVLMK